MKLPSCNSWSLDTWYMAATGQVWLSRYVSPVPLTGVPLRNTFFAELWTSSHLSLLSFFLFQAVPSSNLFKRHWIIPALGVNFFLIKVNCHLFLTLIFNTRRLILVIAMTHTEKCELNIGAHMHQNVPMDGSDTKGRDSTTDMDIQ